ncbi:hypothetical protein LSM04_002016 [Trypanosoma melophagium]|uniref:uncharacterized protein n=1 Tax=Trypanosoma melophagium TaxID=715481 RepID=UPI00351A17F3|nr:hypothetical protein LSM04_002016 [Trypanosoma melophagium]
MKEFFFFCADVNCENLQLRKDELCNRECFAEVVRQALRNANITLNIDEWIDRYWLQQYRKIYAAVAIFLNWEREEREFGRETISGFDSFELATLMYLLTEAGLLLVNTLEISEWVESKRPQRSCALTMDQFAHLLDALSKAVPFSELWLSLLPSGHNSCKTQQRICTYAAIADVTVVEELQEHIMQLQRIVVGRAGDVNNCVKCSRVEEILQKQSARLEAAEAVEENLMAKVRYLEQQLEERQVELTQLQDEHQHTQVLLGDADLRETEFMEMLENTRLQEKEKEYMRCGYEKERIFSVSGGVLTRTAASSPSTTTLLQLLPCSSTSNSSTIAQYKRNDMTNSFARVLNTRGAVAYAIRAEMSRPSHWSVDVFFFFFAARAHALWEARRNVSSFVILMGDVVVLFSLKITNYMFCQESTLVQITGKVFLLAVVIINNNKEKGSDKSLLTKPESGFCGPFAMIDDQVNGISIADIFPRTELLVCYCNFFLHSTLVPLDGKVMKK